MTMATPGPILLVENDAVDLDLTLRAFARRGNANRIDIARDGEEALAFIARWESGHPLPAVILLDINLPRIGGLDVLRQLKAHTRFRRIPVVMLTSSAQECDVTSAYDLGTNSYIVKPVDFGKFVDVAGDIERYWCQLNEAAS
ncbi:MAG: response regulator [Aromatoleum sp.]|uniref:response regulator n=1 Tax=Aromatoleum sp. TaxID=2307007 RepID=UPI0028945752|nr:response regulator [Aromatoleum sp.]MDT3671557.1 response regulator [Aromatoleum sp.]